MSIVPLQTRPLQTNAECIAILQEYLQKAEAGEIVSVAIAALEPSGASLTQCSASEHFQPLIGAVCILQYRMLNESRTPG